MRCVQEDKKKTKHGIYIRIYCVKKKTIVETEKFKDDTREATAEIAAKL
jgi:hypothetical protein